jgi:hypothetical protein
MLITASQYCILVTSVYRYQYLASDDKCQILTIFFTCFVKENSRDPGSEFKKKVEPCKVLYNGRELNPFTTVYTEFYSTALGRTSTFFMNSDPEHWPVARGWVRQQGRSRRGTKWNRRGAHDGWSWAGTPAPTLSAYLAGPKTYQYI